MSEREPWDDDRLAAAFAARAGSPAAATPADLAATAIRVVRDRMAARRGWRQGTRPMLALLGAAVVVAVVAAVTLGPRLSADRGAATAPPSTLPASTVPTDGSTPPVASASTSSASAYGLPVISVPDALAVRSTDDDRELAVRGWFSPVPALPCPYREVKLLLQDECPDQFVILQDAPVDLRPSGSVDVGPNFELYLDDLDPTWQAIDQPVELVVIGHFDDRRAEYCPKDEQQACRDRFVVDRVDRVDGIEQPLSAMNLSEPLEPSRLPDLDRLIEPLGDALILSVLMGEVHDGLPYREPLVSERSLGLSEIDAVWFFHVLVDDELQTFVRIDGDVALYRVDGKALTKVDGVPTPGSGATTPPLATPAPPPPAPEETPPQGHATILTVPAGPGPAVTIGIEDQDALVQDARVATEDEQRQFGGGTALEGVRLEKIAGDDMFYVGWVGSSCDGGFRLVVEGADDTITSLDLYGQRERCDGPTIERSIILRAKRPTDSTGIYATDHVISREFPGSALGMPVLDVEHAQGIQHLANDPREIAIGAWLSFGPPLSCGAPSVEPASRLQPRCGDELTWLLDRPEILDFQDGPTSAFQEPSGPGIHLRFEAPQVDWPTVDDQSTVTPVPIVAIGHFDDAAAATCPPEDATWCRDLFIIDSVAWAYGHDLGFAGLINDPKVKSTPDEIVQAMGAIDPAARIVAAWPTPGRGLGESELGLVNLPKAVRTASRVWIVKVIEAGQLRRYLVVDDALAVYRVLDDGSVDRIYGA